jgi:hypothetical protein
MFAEKNATTVLGGAASKIMFAEKRDYLRST